MEIKTTNAPSGIVKFSLVLFCIALLMAAIYIGQQIIVPLLLALLFAILLNPIVSFLNKRWNVPNVVAVLISCIILFAFVGGILLFQNPVGSTAAVRPQCKKGDLCAGHS